MPDWSRRHALQAAGGVLCTAIAGCNGANSSSRSVPRESRDAVDGSTVLKIRNNDPTPMVARERDETTESPPSEQTTSERPPEHRGSLMTHVTGLDEDGDRRLVFPDDVPGATDLRSFFGETDFEAESIYLAQSTILECYDRHLTGVYRERDSVDAQFCRTVRPADAECRAERYDMVAFAIRLPFAGDEFHGVGGGHSSSCDGPYRSIIDPDTNLTVGGDGGGDE